MTIGNRFVYRGEGLRRLVRVYDDAKPGVKQWSRAS